MKLKTILMAMTACASLSGAAMAAKPGTNTVPLHTVKMVEETITNRNPVSGPAKSERLDRVLRTVRVVRTERSERQERTANERRERAERRRERT